MRGAAMNFIRKYSKNLNLVVGSAILSLFIIILVTSFFYTPYDIEAMDVSSKLEGPSSKHLFGTDHFGRDIFSRVMKGTQTAFFIGTVAVSIGLFFGTIIGGIAGYVGGWLDEIFMRIIDALMAFPGIILALMIVAVFGPGLLNTSFAIGLMAIPGIARIARSGFVQHKEMEYVMSARLIGVHPLKIMFKHILPNVLSPLIVAAS